MSEGTNPSAPPPRARPRRRWILWTLIALGTTVAALLVFLPGLLGPRALQYLASGKLNAPLNAERASFSWLGEQRIEGLRIGPPAGATRSDDLLRVASITVRRGLIGLWRGGERIAIEIESPALFLHRDAAGRFNFDGLVPRRGDAGKREPGAEKRPEDKPPRSGSPIPEIRGLPRDVAVSVRGGQLRHVDELLKVEGEVRSIDASISGGPDDISASLSAVAGSGGSVQARLEANGMASGAGKTAGKASAVLASVDLAPYRGLLERVAGVTPPDRPIHGDASVELGTASLTLAATLDAGFLRVEKLDATVPLDAPGAATCAAALSVDLAAAAASLRGAVPALADARLSGSTRAAIELTGVTSLAELARGPASVPPRSQAHVRIEGSGLDLALTRGGRTHALKEEALLLEVDVEPGKDGGAAIRGEAKSAVLSGRWSGTTGTGAGESPFTLELAADAGVQGLSELLGIALPGSTKIDPGTRARVVDLKLTGVVNGKATDLDTAEMIRRLQGEGKFELAGAVTTAGVTASALTAVARADRGVLALADASSTVNGGRATLSGVTADWSGPEPAFRGALKVEGAACTYELAKLLAYVAPFLALEDKGVLEGTLSGNVELAGRGLDRPGLEKSLTGEGSLRIRQGKILGSRFFAEASRMLGGALGEVLFSEVGSDFKIGGGKVESTRVFLTAREGGKLRNLGLAGHVGLDRSMDFGVDIGALEETVGDKKIQRVLKEARRLFGDKGFPLRLRGSLSEPKLAFAANLESLPGLDAILDEVLAPPAGAGEKQPEKGRGDGGALEEIFDLFNKRRKRK